MQRSLGLPAFVRPNPVEWPSRDLGTHLRQLVPDLMLTEAAAHLLAARPARLMRAGDVLRHLAALPVRDLDATDGGRSAPPLVPHPDDESPSRGGFIAEACRRGRPPYVLVPTDGAGSHPNSRTHPPPVLRAVREGEAGPGSAPRGRARQGIRRHRARATDRRNRAPVSAS